MSQPSLTRTFFQGLFGFEGRMRRSDFWVITIALTMAAALASIALSAAIRQVDPKAVIWPVFLVIQVLVAWPYYAISLKRGHDRGHSGWYTMWVNVGSHLVPLALIFVPLALGWTPRWQGAFWVFIVISLFVFVDYGILEGTPGPNKYGPSPRGPVEV